MEMHLLNRNGNACLRRNVSSMHAFTSNYGTLDYFKE